MITEKQTHKNDTIEYIKKYANMNKKFYYCYKQHKYIKIYNILVKWLNYLDWIIKYAKEDIKILIEDLNELIKHYEWLIFIYRSNEYKQNKYIERVNHLKKFFILINKCNG